MIIYRELSSLERDLEIDAKTLYGVSNHIARHYHRIEVPKKNGALRCLSVPDPILKRIQRRILEVLLFDMEISPYAAAYRFGGGILWNARPHIGKDKLFKLDIRSFFDSILYSQVKEAAFPEAIYAEPLRILLALLCYYGDGLPQGAPTSPAISNIIMKNFDNCLGNWCQNRGICYTRYCDDMTFSGNFDEKEVLDFTAAELKKMGFFINPAKTVTADRYHRQMVTGIVVNQRPSVPEEYRRRLRKELFFCQKFGVEEHRRRLGISDSDPVYLRRLLGQVDYVLSVMPQNKEMCSCRQWLLTQIQNI